MSYDVDQITGAFRAMLPPGLAWNRDPGSNLSHVLAGMAPSFARSAQAAEDLLADAAPIAPINFIEEWEETLSLPDKCIGVPDTFAERQSLIAAKFVAQGGQRIAYFIAVAAALGVEITITEFTEGLVLDVGTLDAPLNNGELWAHHWRVNILTEVVITYFVAGYSASGEPLRKWGNQWIECVINALKPAHTAVSYAYPSGT